MSRQIAVRLPEDVVAFIDGLVAAGAASSRADVVGRALERERRRRAAERDVEILRRGGGGDDLGDLARFAGDRMPGVD